MQRTREQIKDELKIILISADERKKDIVNSCNEDSNLMLDLGLTSIGVLYIVIAIEETFGIRFTDVSIGDFATIGDVIDYIEKKTA